MDTTTATYREILDTLRNAGYTGPHSYTKSRLAEVANEFFTGNPAVPAAVKPHCTCTAEDTGSAHWNGCPLEVPEPKPVVVVGPNLRTKSGETFHVHAADCADLKKSPVYRNHQDEIGYVVHHATRVEVAEDIYCDIIAENPDNRAEDLVSDFKFFPCCGL
jgi:hypothetical protein